MLLTVAICDDDNIQLRELTRLLSEWGMKGGYMLNIQTYTSAESFLFSYQRSGTEHAASPDHGAVQRVLDAVPTSRNCGFRQRWEPQFRVFVGTKTLLVK